jgi:hypothetical protein
MTKSTRARYTLEFKQAAVRTRWLPHAAVRRISGKGAFSFRDPHTRAGEADRLRQF